MIKPQPGMPVHYWPAYKIIGFSYFDANQPCTATIAFARSDYAVNLHVLDQAGYAHALQCVPLRQPGERRPDGEFCEWPEQGLAAGSARAQWEQHEMEREAQREAPTDDDIQADIVIEQYCQTLNGTRCEISLIDESCAEGKSKSRGETGLQLARQAAINHLRHQVQSRQKSG